VGTERHSPARCSARLAAAVRTGVASADEDIAVCEFSCLITLSAEAALPSDVAWIIGADLQIFMKFLLPDFRIPDVVNRFLMNWLAWSNWQKAFSTGQTFSHL
jgi:hypothetical protein